MGINSNLPCSIEDVVDLIGIHVVRNTGTQLHCRCPFCNDTKAHLNVKLEKNVFRCNRCGKGGGVLHLYAAAHDISLNAAYDELCRIFASNGKRPSGSGAMKPVVVNPEQPIANTATRNNTYGNLLSLLSLGASHRESLLLRGLSGDDIVRLGYKTTPAVRSARIVTELLNRGCELEGVPGFFRDQDTGAWKLDIRASGIMLPDRNSKGEIEAIQIRLDKVYKSKFNNLTSAEKYYGTTSACCPHFAGLAEDTKSVYLTEGVMKNQFLRALDELRQCGITRIKVAFDMDAFTNENVMAARERVLKTGTESGFDMTPLRWNPSFKGIDDLLLSFKEHKQITKSIFEGV